MTEPTSSLTPNEQAKSKPSRRYRLLGGLFFLIAATLTAGGVCWFLHNGIGTKAQLPIGATVIYEKTFCQENRTASNRLCNTTIYRIINDKPPEKLAKIKYKSDYLTDEIQFLLSSDRKTLFIGQQGKLQALDLASGQLTELVAAHRGIQAIIPSKNNRQLFLWDQWGESKDYWVHTYDILNKKDKIWAKGELAYPRINEGVWRKDNKILLTGPAESDFGGHTYYFDLKKRQLFPVLYKGDPGPMPYGIVNGAGTLAVHQSGSSDANDLCEGPATFYFKSFIIIDPISLEKIDSVEDQDKAFFVEMFSPNDQEILYFTTEKPKNSEECDKDQTRTYYVYNLKNRTSILVADYQQLREQWSAAPEKPSEVFITAKKDKMRGGNQFFYRTDNLHIIAAYIQR